MHRRPRPFRVWGPNECMCGCQGGACYRPDGSFAFQLRDPGEVASAEGRDPCVRSGDFRGSGHVVSVQGSSGPLLRNAFSCPPRPSLSWRDILAGLSPL